MKKGRKKNLDTFGSFGKVKVSGSKVKLSSLSTKRKYTPNNNDINIKKKDILEQRRNHMKLISNFQKERDFLKIQIKEKTILVSALKNKLEQRDDSEIVLQLKDEEIKKFKIQIRDLNEKLKEYKLYIKHQDKKNLSKIINEYKRMFKQLELSKNTEVDELKKKIELKDNRVNGLENEVNLLGDENNRLKIKLSNLAESYEILQEDLKKNKINELNKNEEMEKEIGVIRKEKTDSIEHLKKEFLSKTDRIVEEKNKKISKIENMNKKLIEDEQILKNHYTKQLLEKEEEIKNIKRKNDNFTSFKEINSDILEILEEMNELKKLIILNKESEYSNLSILNLNPKKEEKFDENDVFQNISLLKKEIQIVKSKTMEISAKFYSQNECKVQ